MISEKELQSLISLLDDSDDEVLQHVENKLLSLGEEAIPLLENYWQNTFDVVVQNRIEGVIHQIQFDKVKTDLKEWCQSDEQDLLRGIWLIARYRYPDLKIEDIEYEINQLKLDVWLEMHNVLSPLEKVRVLNHVLYNVHGYKGNTGDYHSPQNSFINYVLETKKGNPISMAIMYSLVAQRLNLPVYGVNLPQHFLLAYKEENENWHYESDAYNVHRPLDAQDGKVLFYINAFNNGVILSRKNLEQFIHQLHLEPKQIYFEPCTNMAIIARVLRNLFHAYEKMVQRDKCNEINEMLVIVGEEAIPFTSPKEKPDEGQDDGNDEDQ